MGICCARVAVYGSTLRCWHVSIWVSLALVNSVGIYFASSVCCEYFDGVCILYFK